LRSTGFRVRVPTEADASVAQSVEHVHDEKCI
jgi:hypothetical protein